MLVAHYLPSMTVWEIADLDIHSFDSLLDAVTRSHYGDKIEDAWSRHVAFSKSKDVKKFVGPWKQLITEANRGSIAEQEEKEKERKRPGVNKAGLSAFLRAVGHRGPKKEG